MTELSARHQVSRKFLYQQANKGEQALAQAFQSPLSGDEAVVKARQINARQDLSRVRTGSHDELFQGREPVLVGLDLDST